MTESRQPKTEYSRLALIGFEPKDATTIFKLAETKYIVACYDIDQTKLDNISKPKSPPQTGMAKGMRQLIKAGNISFTNELQEAITNANVLLLNLSVRMDGKRKANYRSINETCQQIGTHMQKGTTIIVTTVIGVGANATEIKETLENASGFRTGMDFTLAYCPRFLSSCEKSDGEVCLLAAFDENSLRTTSTILETISQSSIRKTLNVKAVEAATLFKAIERDLNAAAKLEFAIFCEKSGINYTDTVELIRNENDPFPFPPSFSRTQSFLEERLLAENAENTMARLRVASLAEDANSDMIKHAVNLVKEGLAECGKTLKRAKIAVLGAMSVADKNEVSKTVMKLCETLDRRGARLRLYDPAVEQKDVSDDHVAVKANLTEALEGADCAVATAKSEHFARLDARKLRLMMKMPAAVVDLDFVFDAEKIEKEGFTYRGLGRGATST